MYTTNDDTICAPATVPGTGAISIIRVSGPKAIEIAAEVVSCKDLADAPGYTIRFGTVFQANGKPLDDVLVSIFRAPHSYTGEDSVEISCHASKFIAEGIMQLLIKAGARTAEPGEFTQRAFINGKMDLTQAEAVADLIASQNAAAHRVAMNQLKGGFSKELKKMREQMLHIVSLMELELDFSDEEVQFADRRELDDLLKATIKHISTLMESFRLGNVIKNGVPVAIVGATNTGKSTLLNALLGEERAIVSDVHGTTRDTVEETMNIDGILFRFIDTAGIRQTDETVEKIGIERTYKKLHEAAIVLAMLDITRSEAELAESIKEILDKVDLKQQKLIFLLNKCDLTEAGNYGKDDNSARNNFVNIKNYIVSLIEEHNIKLYGKFQWYEANAKGNLKDAIGIMPISAKTGEGLDALRTTLSATQKDLLADSDTTLITNARHYEALSNARDALVRVRAGLSDALPTDLLTQDIREALYHIGSIVGEISTDEVLGNIFRNFCIGK
ncbi:MAG: tRNA uridine-5-carboxymethylaminomethyl(34) synthesis GTPase MnmE [Bacteroidetes bacterium]|uniref:tRNA modification GTPase MnmE n=1 Tax=Candidatus Cryptobacteroides intestinigallinarum TaxID=2840767 RepID=A0A9D9HMI7_9BACT|nr:tRNA uridine-5-carboxymethylaminomethyl(34) synthesis GTPase MnmE [Candidatus Cryptobacteroides intestinigallinarum]